jgi:hypothetical protein
MKCQRKGWENGSDTGWRRYFARFYPFLQHTSGQIFEDDMNCFSSILDISFMVAEGSYIFFIFWISPTQVPAKVLFFLFPIGGLNHGLIILKDSLSGGRGPSTYRRVQLSPGDMTNFVYIQNKCTRGMYSPVRYGEKPLPCQQGLHSEEVSLPDLTKIIRLAGPLL